MTSALQIRPIADQDRAEVLEIARELVTAADTYAFEPDIDDESLWRYWNPQEPRSGGYVASMGQKVVGVFVIKPNHPGPAGHVANASYAVGVRARGRGVGRQMGEASLRCAVELGYLAMQFNIVISTNQAAIRLWESMGFQIVGTIPRGFRHKDGRLVDHHIMHRSLLGVSGV